MSENRDLFGRPIIDPMKAEQIPLFHEPVQPPAPELDKTDARIARKFRNCPTGELFSKPQDKRPNKPACPLLADTLTRRFGDMNEKAYNGWTNYETWAIHLWLSNDQGSWDYWQQVAAEHIETHREDRQVLDGIYSPREAVMFALADTLKDELKDGESNPLAEGGSMYADLLRASLDEVNWQGGSTPPASSRSAAQATRASQF